MSIRSINVLLTVFFLSACSFSLTEDIKPPQNYASPTSLPEIGDLYPDISPSIVNGEEIYRENCSPCHGEDGLGNGVIASQLPVAVPAIGLADISRQISPADWYVKISRGNMERGMPPFYNHAESERWDVLAYVFSLSSSKEEHQLGKNLYELECLECHGLDGDKVVSTDFSNQEYMAFLSNLDLYRGIAEGKSEMHSFEGEITKDDIWALTTYIRSLSLSLVKPDVTSTVTTEPTTTYTPDISPTEETSLSETTEGTVEIEEATLTILPPTGVVEGNVINQSGSKLIGKLQASLIYFDITNQQVYDTQLSEVTVDGQFLFTDIPLDANTAYWVTVEYEDVDYYSDYIIFDGTSFEYELTVSVYDSSKDWSNLSFELVHIALEFSNDLLQVSELFVFRNSNLFTVLVETDGMMLPFIRLPDGVNELTGLSPDSSSLPFLKAKGGVAFPPEIDGQYGVVASFSLPYDRKIDYLQEFPIEIKSISLFAPDGVRIKTDQLEEKGTQDFNGSLFQIYEFSNFSKGYLALSISGKPTNNRLLNLPQSSGIVIGVGVLGVILVAVGIYLFIRDRSSLKTNKRGSTGSEEPIRDNSTEEILDAIITLDEKLKNDEISLETHSKRRKKLFETLKNKN